MPYKGAAPAVTDVIGGHVAMTFAPIAAVVSPIRAGKLRALAVTAATRSDVFPDLPTISESGVAGYDASGWNALFAPRQMPQDTIRKVNSAVAQSLEAPKVQQVLVSAGAEAAAGTPEALAEFLRAEMAKWAKVVRAAGIKPE